MDLQTHDKYGYQYVSAPQEKNEIKALYSERFYERDKPSYLTKVDSELPYWKAIFGLRIQCMEKIAGNRGSILDVGAGGGFFLETAKGRGWHVFGVEPSARAVAFAKKRFNIDIFCGFLDDYPTPQQPFDAIHTSLVLEHVEDPEAFVKKALSMLKPGGVLWVETPNDFNPLQMAITAQLDKNQWWVVPDHHLNYFSYDSLSRLLEAQGSKEVERVASFPIDMFPLMGLNYIGNDENGAKAHGMRMTFEQNLIDYQPELLLDIYRKLAQAGIGRTCSVMVQKI